MSQKTIVFIAILGSLLLSNSTATHVVNSEILILRSQFVESNPLEDSEQWSNAGLLHILFPDTISATLKYVNDENNLYLFLEFSGFNQTFDEIGMAFYLDSDGDGQLVTPEDAFSLRYNANANGFLSQDHYFDGTNWVEDPDTSTVEDLHTFTQGKLQWSILIPLLSNNLQYDALQIPNPANSFIALSFQFYRLVGNASNVINYPTTPTNASGFVDMKLAGPEDKDLPSYVPPATTVVDTTRTTGVGVDGGGGVFSDIQQASFQSILPGLILFQLAYIISRRRKS